MKIFNHPIHIILIHFPSALFPLDLLFACLAKYYDIQQLNYVSACMILTGTLFGFLAIITGLFDIAPLAQRKPNSLKKALVHGGLNTVVIITYAFLSMAVYNKLPQVPYDSLGILTLKFSSVTLLIIGNFLGADLVLKDKVLD